MRAAIGQQSDSSPRNQLEKILENELNQLQQRILETAKGEFFFDVSDQAREFLLLKGQRYGAQHLKLAIEGHIVFPLADLFVMDQVFAGDMVCIDRDQNQPRLTFTRERKDLAAQARLLAPLMEYIPARTGKSVEVLGI
jgi:ATP-dependent Clp protease ATP-binding subunit ClpA